MPPHDSDRPRAKRVPPPKSDWSPRPIPQSAPERRTADPRTPKLAELRARAPQRAALATPAAAPTPPTAPTMSAAQCAAAWRDIGAQTTRVLNSGGGDATPAQKLTRNRAISAAYADLARGDPRMRWAGLASVVSTQAHCAMQDADTAVGRADTAAGVTRFMPAVGPATQLTADMARQVQDALYDTNREIFSDIYPNVAMYKAHGRSGIAPRAEGGCGDDRPDRPMAPQIRRALEQIDDGDVAQGSHSLADYEQKVIVQQRIYDDPRRPLLRTAMQANQLASDTPVVRDVANALMKARKPEVAISAECGKGTPVPFPGDITVAQHRVDYYDRLVATYMRQDQGTRDAMGRVISARDPLRGGGDYGAKSESWFSWPPTLRF